MGKKLDRIFTYFSGTPADMEKNIFLLYDGQNHIEFFFGLIQKLI